MNTLLIILLVGGCIGMHLWMMRKMHRGNHEEHTDGSDKKTDHHDHEGHCH